MSSDPNAQVPSPDASPQLAPGSPTPKPQRSVALWVMAGVVAVLLVAVAVLVTVLVMQGSGQEDAPAPE